MRQMFSFGRRGFLAGAALAVAVFAWGGPDASAEIISMTITTSGGTIDVAAFVTGGADSRNFGTVDLASLNAALAGLGSSYAFTDLGGTSNWSGGASGGFLQLSGGIVNVRAGDTFLKIDESEDGFILPTGLTGTLNSSSTGNYANAGAGNSHDASSSYNATTIAGPYTLASTQGGVDPTTGTASAIIPAFTTPYTLGNSITFSLSKLLAFDGFSVNARAVAVPEPASVLTLSLGLPISFLAIAWRRRTRAQAHAA
jgi:hypothetical protein